MAENVLQAIVARKREDVATRLAGVTIEDLRGRAGPTRRSLRGALARPGARFIMEVKRASPSQGALKEKADPAVIAAAYRGPADAMSVLTDTPYFQGSLDDLRTVRAVFDGPILAKDFVVDPRQVPEARLHGADAVLAMLSVLSPAEAEAVIAEARRLNMDVLVEAHSEEEVRQAVALGAKIIGINNRDLTSLTVDLAVTERLAHLVPADRLLVAESGIDNRRDVERLAPHADAFHVGSSLMRAPDPGRAARELAYGRVKVCGLTRPQDAEAAAVGASHAGLIFVPQSPRAVTRAEAKPVLEVAREQGLETVGVFRNEKLMEVAQTARALELNAVQLHGAEDAGYIAGLRNLIGPGTEIWAASAVGASGPGRRYGADRTLFDTEANGRSGGTGVPFDWARLDDPAAVQTGILAGGLNPANAQAASRIGAWALDVNSGVEDAPGHKNPDKLSAFFEALRVPSRQETNTCV